MFTNCSLPWASNVQTVISCIFPFCEVPTDLKTGPSPLTGAYSSWVIQPMLQAQFKLRSIHLYERQYPLILFPFISPKLYSTFG